MGFFTKNRGFGSIGGVGVLAQLVERVVRNDEVRSSILLHSTKELFVILDVQI